MKSNEFRPAIMESLDVIISYKKGGVSLDNATTLFSAQTGLAPRIAEKFLRGLSRENVIQLRQQAKQLDE